jgi:hypothetical protein
MEENKEAWKFTMKLLRLQKQRKAAVKFAKEVEIDNVGSSFFSSKPQAAAPGQRGIG